MRYTKPLIVSTETAISAIQSQASTAEVKQADIYQDSHQPPVACTFFAYEADE